MSKLRILGSVLPLILAACEDGTAQAGVCTRIFVSQTVTVVDSTGQPAQGFTARSILRRTGDTLTPQALAQWAQGTHVVVDDGALKLLREDGDYVDVTAEAGPAKVSAAYLVDVPDGCHVRIKEGPDTLVLR
jgi:hypothetical protein